jgi:hypothetical protein
MVSRCGQYQAPSLGASSVRRAGNLRRLVAALAHGALGPAAASELLRVSSRAARNYLGSLLEAGVAVQEPRQRGQLRLHPDMERVQDFLRSLEDTALRPRVALRRSPSRHCVDPGTQFLHVLADDARFPLVLDRLPVRRDPLVAALFGSKAPQ